jgi:hypothetical protein
VAAGTIIRERQNPLDRRPEELFDLAAEGSPSSTTSSSQASRTAVTSSPGGGPPLLDGHAAEEAVAAALAIGVVSVRRRAENPQRPRSVTIWGARRRGAPTRQEGQ